MKPISLSGLVLLLVLAACGNNDDADSQAGTAEPKPVASVRIITIEQGDLGTWVFGEGTARALQREFLSFESAGRIEYVDPQLKEGDAISAGQVIAYQQQDRSNAELASAQARVVDAQSQHTIAEASLEEADANFSLAENTFNRYQTLLEQTSASQQEFEEATARLEQARVGTVRAERQLTASLAQIDSAKAQLDRADITVRESRLVSPIDGILARLIIEQGYFFSPQQVQSSSEAGALSTVPVLIVDASAFEITVNLPSYEFRQLQTEREVLIQLDQTSLNQISARPVVSYGPARSAQDFEVVGEVYAVSPSVDPETRTFAVKIRTTSGHELLQDGEFVTVWIAGPSAEDTLIIPLNATRFDNGQAYVFVYDEVSKTVSRRDVELGLRGIQRQQVLSGLTAGTRVVTDGKSKLADGDVVRSI